MEEVYKSGRDRYKEKIPPGFEDEKPELDEDGKPSKHGKFGNAIYGDLVLWQQVLRHAKDNSRDILLVTDDRKID